METKVIPVLIVKKLNITSGRQINHVGTQILELACSWQESLLWWLLRAIGIDAWFDAEISVLAELGGLLF